MSPQTLWSNNWSSKSLTYYPCVSTCYWVAPRFTPLKSCSHPSIQMSSSHIKTPLSLFTEIVKKLRSTGLFYSIQIKEGNLAVLGFKIQTLRTISLAEEQVVENFLVVVDFNPYSSLNIVAMTMKMSYFQGIGMGRIGHQ